MKQTPLFSIANCSFSLLFVVLLTGTACAKTSPESESKVITTVVKEGVPGKGNVNNVEMTTTTVMQEGVPGRITVNSVEVSAEVTAIDTENRKITLLLSEGDEETVVVPPEAVNFDQIEVGDMVKATLTEALVIYLDEEDVEIPDGFAASVALAPKGAKPAGIVAGTRKVTATVVAIDQSQRTATLRFDEDTVETFPVREDIDLSQHEEGEKVVFIVAEAVALSVEKP